MGDAEGAKQTEGGADERELRSGSEHEAGDVSGLGSQREADPEFAGALGRGASEDAVDAQGGQAEPEHGQRGQYAAEDAQLVVGPRDSRFGALGGAAAMGRQTGPCHAIRCVRVVNDLRPWAECAQL